MGSHHNARAGQLSNLHGTLPLPFAEQAAGPLAAPPEGMSPTHQKRLVQPSSTPSIASPADRLTALFHARQIPSSKL
jgi:hypothetical protein